MGFIIEDIKIEIGEDDFNGDKDWLDRKTFAERLSGFSNNVNTKMVMALDGDWGSGKSHFLKLWVGHHKKNHETDVIYFDAFEHDFMQDALSAILVSLLEKFKGEKNPHQKLITVTSKATKLIRPIMRIGLNVAGAFITGLPNTGTAIDAAVESASEELQNGTSAKGKDYWQEELERKAAIEGFRTALQDFVETLPNKKLVIIIDELDRCRPDFALDILEITKHLFAVNGLHVLMGVNLQELQNSVKARYGSGIDAARYLHKFFDLELGMQARDQLDTYIGYSDARQYFAELMARSKYESDRLSKLISAIFFDSKHQQLDISLRDVERLFKNLVLYGANQTPFASYIGVILKTFAPELLKKVLRAEADYDDICEVLLLPTAKEVAACIDGPVQNAQPLDNPEYYVLNFFTDEYARYVDRRFLEIDVDLRPEQRPKELAIMLKRNFGLE